MFRSGMHMLNNIALSATLLAALAAPAAAQHGGGHGGSSHGGGGDWHGGGDGHGGYDHRGYDRGYGYGGYYGGDWWGFGGYYPYGYAYYGNAYPYYPVPPVGGPPVGGPPIDAAPYPTPLPATAPAEISIHVPSGATLWFDDTEMSQKGEWRSYRTPPLNTDRTSTYDIRARWTDPSGRPVEQVRKLEVRGGARATLDFARPSAGE